MTNCGCKDGKTCTCTDCKCDACPCEGNCKAQKKGCCTKKADGTCMCDKCGKQCGKDCDCKDCHCCKEMAGHEGHEHASGQKCGAVKH